ncbi:uncharacterized protein TRAVEDRAFT_50401 [Trametes versicolor FP-101664 SS1]|uniref:uncharacterized protein n=1 Tax=Trametes versicolor (strain FP-101664) TaxID=717944 RepID=UPI0004623F44|nr:uncharacterized protein TRAVEDRAFT_50401 [Trametes versicolor FP-101664 SS1]EIW55913.1 hypothetical protein TRAVEDRAFT_50401 [Trametes versicolor FP-101664 SS1]
MDAGLGEPGSVQPQGGSFRTATTEEPGISSRAQDERIAAAKSRPARETLVRAAVPPRGTPSAAADADADADSEPARPSSHPRPRLSPSHGHAQRPHTPTPLQMTLVMHDVYVVVRRVSVRGHAGEIEGTLVDYKKPQDVSGAFIEKCAKKRTRETLADAEPAVVVSIDTAVGVPAGEPADDAEPESVGSCEAGAELEAALLGSVTDADASVPELAALVAVDVGDPPPLVSVACRLQ